MRRIIHLDMDAFYAAIEQRDHPELRGKPVIVGGDRSRGVVATASYEARPYGVHSAMPMAQALKLCPQAIVVPPRREQYLTVSRQIFTILRSFTPLVEPLSLDEAFLDVTASERLFGSAREIALQIKARIQAETQLTASAGIAPNKFVAKIASDLQKPNGLVEVRPEDVLSFIHPLPVTRLWGVGRVTAKTLYGMGIQCIGDLARFSRETLVTRFGAQGDHLFNLSRGLDDRPVDPNQALKSLGEEETFSHDLTLDGEVYAALLRQAQTVAQRLRSRSLAGRTITVKIKLAERLGEGRFRMYTRSHTLPSPTNDAQEIYRAALSLYRAVPRRGVSVRLAGVYASNLELERSEEQLDLFTPAPQQHDKRRRLGQLLDQLTARYGEHIVRFGETRTMASQRSRDPASLRKEELLDPLTAEKKER
ncbi:MAG TPA: DNA polymerase IV [Methylomirabilota bacterium]|nr:DNA polymerase IV [Methylomirabilota bacterium]